MSEANILNPTAGSLLNFDYGYSEGLPEMRSVFQAQSGKAYARRQLGRGRIYELIWNNRDKATMHALRQWARQYENDFFTLVDWERTRYFSGRFDEPLQFSPAGNDKWNIKGRFIELPGLALNTYPTDWTRDAIFLEERNGFGEDLVKLVGAPWTYGTGGSHGGAQYTHSNLVDTDSAAWLYFGYGCRLWVEKHSNWGILQFKVTRVRDGTVVQAATDVDLYNASSVNSAPLITVASLALDLYRAEVLTTNRKNAASSANTIAADALEAMQ